MEFMGICLISPDVPRLARFYMEVLGIEAEGDDVHIELRTEGASLAIFSVDGMESMAPHSMAGAGYGSLTISIKVKDVDVEYERLRTLGVSFVRFPTTNPWGWRSFWFRDPDGNIVNFACEVAQ